MNAFVLSDLHAHWNWPHSQVSSSGLPDRFQDLLNVLKQAEMEIENRQPTTLLLLGDLTHRRHFISWRLYNPLWDQLRRLTDRVDQTIILVGNHDYEDDVEHSLHVLSGLPNTEIVEAPAILATGEGDANFLPYLHSPEAVLGAIEKDFSNELPLFGHYGTEGVPLESDYWLDSPLKLGEVARFPFTVFGHIHKPSDLLGGRVTYVGAPMHFDFGDRGGRGGLHIKDSTIERVPFTSPQFTTATWPRIPMPPKSGGYLRLVNVPLEKSLDAREVIRAAGWRDGVVVKLEEVVDAAQRSVQNGLVLDEAMLRDWVAHKLPDLQEGDEVDALVDEGMSLLRRASP